MIPTNLRYSPLLQVSENGAVEMRHESRDLQGALYPIDLHVWELCILIGVYNEILNRFMYVSLPKIMHLSFFRLRSNS